MLSMHLNPVLNKNVFLNWDLSLWFDMTVYLLLKVKINVFLNTKLSVIQFIQYLYKMKLKI